MTGRFYRLCAIFPPSTALVMAAAGYDVLAYLPIGWQRADEWSLGVVS